MTTEDMEHEIRTLDKEVDKLWEFVTNLESRLSSYLHAQITAQSPVPSLFETIVMPINGSFPSYYVLSGDTNNE